MFNRPTNNLVFLFDHNQSSLQRESKLINVCEIKKKKVSTNEDILFNGGMASLIWIDSIEVFDNTIVENISIKLERFDDKNEKDFIWRNIPWKVIEVLSEKQVLQQSVIYRINHKLFLEEMFPIISTKLKLWFNISTKKNTMVNVYFKNIYTDAEERLRLHDISKKINIQQVWCQHHKKSKIWNNEDFGLLGTGFILHTKTKFNDIKCRIQDWTGGGVIDIFNYTFYDLQYYGKDLTNYDNILEGYYFWIPFHPHKDIYDYDPTKTYINLQVDVIRFEFNEEVEGTVYMFNKNLIGFNKGICGVKFQT